MKCPFCGEPESKVIDTRLNQSLDVTRRRRECLKCNNRFTTYERVEEILPVVIKKDGRRENFNREKVIAGLTKACQKRPIKTAQIEKMADDLEKKIREFGVKEIPANIIGHVLMASLHTMDTVAYVRFASVYRQFRDVDEFVADLREFPLAEELDKIETEQVKMFE